jgi:hypothetical protein
MPLTSATILAAAGKEMLPVVRMPGVPSPPAEMRPLMAAALRVPLPARVPSAPTVITFEFVAMEPLCTSVPALTVSVPARGLLRIAEVVGLVPVSVSVPVPSLTTRRFL